MIVVSDTSPLNYLALIGAENILHELFGEVIVPQAVADELQVAAAPEKVRTFLAKAPAWLVICAPRNVDATLPPRLGAGEQEAISLAAELSADVLLCDDEKARKSAIERGVRVMGTLGIVKLASVKGLLDFEACIHDLQKTTLRLPTNLVMELLKEEAERKRG